MGFSPDRGAAGHHQWYGTAGIWRVDTGQQLHTLTGHTGEVWQVAFSPDGTLLATTGSGGTARIWRLATTAR